MKDPIQKNDLTLLTQPPHAPVVSIYLDTHRKGHQTLEQQDATQLKNLLKEARQKLADSGYDLEKTTVDDIFKPAEALLEDAGYWRHQDHGLALFLGQGLFKTYRLPHNVRNRVVVDATAWIVPLTNTLNKQDRYYVLAVSQGHVRLLEASPYEINLVPMDGDIPTSREEAEQFEDGEPQLQWRGGVAGRLGQGAMFHGQGEGKDTYKTDIARYFHDIGRPLEHQLNATKPLPLLFAGLAFEFAIFKETTRYNHLLEDRFIEGNADDLSDKELHGRSLEVMQDFFRRARHEKRDKVQQFYGTDQASEDPYDVVRSALMGKVDTLFVANNKEIWGKVDLETFETSPAEGPAPATRELLNYAAVQTLMKSGEVFMVDVTEDEISMPGTTNDSGMVGLYRF
ncbi:MAG: hypothetical protein WBA12_05820 [Catalinimonas sp.]